MDSHPQPLQRCALEPPIRFDPGLVEQAVLLAVESAAAEKRRCFRAARDPIYEIEDAGRREAGFAALHACWFDRLRIGEPLLRLVCERPSVARSIAACLVVPAPRRKDEHADLRRALPAGGTGTDRPVLIVQLLPATLVDAGRLGGLLRRELLQVADMLDPAFGYDPKVALRETSGPLASLLRERHALLWRVTVDGRLARQGELGEQNVRRLRSRFRSVFGMLPRSGEAVFRSLLSGPRPSHRELMRLARSPGGDAQGAGECPLCHMPTPSAQLEAETLSERAGVAARLDFPDWRPEDGICPHCADLYELRDRAGATRATT